MNLRAEQHNIVLTALSYGIDPHLVLAIRLHEGDPPIDSEYGEFGMPRNIYQNYQKRLNGSCATLRGLLQAYLGNPYQIVYTASGHRRLRYLDAVIAFVGAKYCPVGPGLPEKNRNWIPGVTQLYTERVAENAPLV